MYIYIYPYIQNVLSFSMGGLQKFNECADKESLPTRLTPAQFRGMILIARCFWEMQPKCTAYLAVNVLCDLEKSCNIVPCKDVMPGVIKIMLSAV